MSGDAIFDSGPGAIRRALARELAPPSVRVSIKADPRRAMRDLKRCEALVHNLDKPLSIPTAQEIVMRQELGEFDV